MGNKFQIPIENFANSVKLRTGNAELNTLYPIYENKGNGVKCVETIYEAVSNN